MCNLLQNNVYPTSPQNLLLSAVEGAMVEFQAEVDKSLKESKKRSEKIDQDLEGLDKDLDELDKDDDEIKKDLKKFKEISDRLSKKNKAMTDNLNNRNEVPKKLPAPVTNDLTEPVSSNPPRDLEKERVVKLRSSKNKAIIYASVLIACVAVNILLLIFLPIPQALLSLVGFAPIYYFVGSNLVPEIKDYNSLKNK